jgi:glycosyltransferase involved in cell wall biosynthesis
MKGVLKTGASTEIGSGLRLDMELGDASGARPKNGVASRQSARLPRVAVIADLREEGWPSMDLVARMLFEGLRREHAGEFSAELICPPMRRRFSGAGQTSGARFNTDRLINRFRDYPRQVRRVRGEFDLFHIVDHSYSQLLHQLPPERTVVTCHDLDTFRCLLDPSTEPRPAPFRLMTRRVLDGFRKAARVACDSTSTRDELLGQGLFSPERVAVIPNGVHPAFSPERDAEAEREAARLLGGMEEGACDLLHVGSTVGRKRIDVLLETFAAVRKEFPRARLIRVGGEMSAAQKSLAAKLKACDALVVLPYLKTEVLAAVYRRAALVLQPSEREGFGLPVVEAMACGAHVVASDLPVLREVCGDAATFCAVGDAASWARASVGLLRERASGGASWHARGEAGIRRSSRFTWEGYVEKTIALYRELLA